MSYAENDIPDADLARARRKLNITWEDSDTEEKLRETILDAEDWLNDKLGAEMDYSAPGQARQLFLNLLLYVWNDSKDQFEGAYKSDILTIRHQNEVKAAKEAAENA